MPRSLAFPLDYTPLYHCSTKTIFTSSERSKNTRNTLSHNVNNKKLKPRPTLSKKHKYIKRTKIYFVDIDRRYFFMP